MFEEQTRQIEKMLRESALTLNEFADRAALKPETMRKYLGGYQRAGSRTMQMLAHMAELEDAICGGGGPRASWDT